MMPEDRIADLIDHIHRTQNLIDRVLVLVENLQDRIIALERKRIKGNRKVAK
jgi:hypothetical protein